MRKKIKQNYSLVFCLLVLFCFVLTPPPKKKKTQSFELLKNTREIYFNIRKVVYSNPITNMKLNGEKLKVISLNARIRQVCPHVFGVVLEG